MTFDEALIHEKQIRKSYLEQQLETVRGLLKDLDILDFEIAMEKDGWEVGE